MVKCSSEKSLNVNVNKNVNVKQSKLQKAKLWSVKHVYSMADWTNRLITPIK